MMMSSSRSRQSKRTTTASSIQPAVQITAKKLEYLYRRRNRTSSSTTTTTNSGVTSTQWQKKKSRYEVFMYWLEGGRGSSSGEDDDTSILENLSKTTSLKDISLCARRLLILVEECNANNALLQWIEEEKEENKVQEMKPVQERRNRTAIMMASKKHQSSSLLLTTIPEKKAIGEERKRSYFQLKECKYEIEAWLFLVAIYILWKKECNYADALALCSTAISVTTSFINDILTLSPRSLLDKEENDDKVLCLQKLKSMLQDYNSAISQQLNDHVAAVTHDDDDDVDDDYEERSKQHVIDSTTRSSDSNCNPSKLKGKKTALQSKMTEFLNKKKRSLESNSLKTRDQEHSTNKVIQSSLPVASLSVNAGSSNSSCRTSTNNVVKEDGGGESTVCNKVTMSNFLYPHLVYHPYFNRVGK